VHAIKQDVFHTLRLLLKRPAFAIVAVLTLALGIGTNTAIFSIVNGWLRPLPAKDPDQLMVLAAQQMGDTLGSFYLSYPELVDFRNQGATFSDFFAFRVGLGGLSFNGKAEPLLCSYVTGNYFTALGIQPAAGQLFRPGQGEQPGADGLVVLGYSYWQKRFAGNPNIVGKQVRVDGKGAVVIGVAPRGFRGVSSYLDIQAYLPLNMALGDAEGNDLWADRNQRVLTVLGRLKSGVSLNQAQSSVNVVAERLSLEYPKSNVGVSVTVVPEKLARPIPKIASAVPLVTSSFLTLAGVVLLLACMNVGNLMLVRATGRQREIAVRLALGATRARVVREMLTESIVLALLSGVSGILLGMWVCGMIASADLGTKLPIVLDFSADWRVIIYSLASALATGVIVGMWPALRATRGGISTILQDGGRGGSGGAGRSRVRSFLVVAQVAGSLMLLIVAARFLRSLDNAQHMSLGFDPNNVLNVTLDPHQVGYDKAATIEFYRELEKHVASLPGVQSATQAYSVPMGNYTDGSQVYVEGHPLSRGERPALVFLNRVGPSYFDTMRIALLQGRSFTDTDNATSPLVAIVNQTMADRFWPSADPIGKRFSAKSASGPFIQVVGVAHDSMLFGTFFTPLPFYYVPLDQSFTSLRTLQIRSSIAPGSLTTQVEKEIQNLNPEMSVTDLQTMREVMAGGNGFMIFRLAAILTAVAGTLGFVIAVVGIYGVVSFVGAQRTREIGVRMAVGANRADIVKLILGQGARLVSIGTVAGLLAAFALTRAMGTLLLGVRAGDLGTLVPVTLMVLLVAMGACYVPARRAMNLHPVVALRHD
jgi:predicted permease